MEKNKIISILIAIFIIILIIGGILIHQKEKENELNYFEIYDTSEAQDTTETVKTIKIHISGEVNYKGILELKEGSRINDAIKQAGGITEKADIDKINLAYELSDGQKLYIPNINEKEKKEYITEDSGIEIEEEKEEKININKATQTELETLPGIGPSLALKIIRYREENGKFNNIEELKNVKGVGENKYEEIKELIKVK
ncbi:MAG: helix-hairpin-helix domain-containing protein [Candidatus Scatovivens sp.]